MTVVYSTTRTSVSPVRAVAGGAGVVALTAAMGGIVRKQSGKWSEAAAAAAMVGVGAAASYGIGLHDQKAEVGRNVWIGLGLGAATGVGISLASKKGLGHAFGAGLPTGAFLGGMAAMLAIPLLGMVIETKREAVPLGPGWV